MENETIYMKTKKEGLWEECPAVACLGYMAIGLILFFVLFFSPFCYGIATENAIVVLLEPIAMILGLFSLGYFSVYKIVQTNNEKNISKSIALCGPPLQRFVGLRAGQELLQPLPELPCTCLLVLSLRQQLCRIISKSHQKYSPWKMKLGNKDRIHLCLVPR